MAHENDRLSESDTRAKLITPALHRRGWTEDMIRREETAGAITKTDRGVRRGKKVADYVLRAPVPKAGSAPVILALLEAKKNTDSPAAGMEQVKNYARQAKRFNVPFLYSTNGYKFVEYSRIGNKTTAPAMLSEFPTPDMLRRRYEEYIGVSLQEPKSRALTTPYVNGDNSRRYYQDAAIRAALEKIAYDTSQGRPCRLLLNLATGAGKTFIAVNLLKRLFDAGNVGRALFLCDRDALRGQALAHFQAVFGNDAEVARRIDGGKRNQAENARIHIATYQTLGISGDDDDDATFAAEHYPPGYFSHIIVDECHRSLRNGWAEILEKNADAVHIGLTATPKQVENESEEDREISSRNLQYFGEPVYTYTLPQGADDGYLALCEIHKSEVNIDKHGLTMEEVMRHQPRNYRDGKLLTWEEIKAMYDKTDYESILMLPDRVDAMCRDLFGKLSANGAPTRKTIIFCVRREHAEMVNSKLNNLYSEWCAARGEKPADPYAFVCMSAAGSENLASFKSEDNHHFVAATVDLLATGVDIPAVRNIVFFCYVKSPIRVQQMIGRGARIDETRGKLSFSVYDYTNATDLLDSAWKPSLPATSGGSGGGDDNPPPVLAQIDGLAVCVDESRRFILISDEDGRQQRVDADEYRSRLARAFLQKVKTLDDLRAIWIAPARRNELLRQLKDMGYSLRALAELFKKTECDDYDIAACAMYGTAAKTRRERVEAFHLLNKDWLAEQPERVAAVLQAIIAQFAANGIEELESAELFNTPGVKNAGGLEAFSEAHGSPKQLIEEAKRRLFAA